jgi:hypothetical protein
MVGTVVRASQQFQAEKIIFVITQPMFSPDLAPSDFWLFSTLEMILNNKSNVMTNSERFQKMPSAGTSNVERKSVRV